VVREDTRPTAAEVDLDAIRDNVAVIRNRLAPRTRLMAVVKADGYGHGAEAVARAAIGAGAAALGVALPEEGALLREAGITHPILVLGATLPPQWPLLVRFRLETVVSDAATARGIAAVARAAGQSVGVHLKIDTGMGRIGLAADGPVLELAELLAHEPGIAWEGLMSHLADADDPDPAYTREQYRRFLGVVERLRRAGREPPLLHLANSAATFRFPGLHLDQVRVGLALYGLLSGVPGAEALRPALRLVSRLVLVKQLPPGHGVGYGHTFRTTRRTRIGIVPVGYADGYRRGLSNRAWVLIGGRRVPVVGRVSMDQIAVALPDSLEAAPGDEVVLLGRQGAHAVTADDWARWLDTIPYEVVTGIGARVPRRYRTNSAQDSGAGPRQEAAVAEEARS
jgi:alanine racemase